MHDILKCKLKGELYIFYLNIMKKHFVFTSE